MKNVVNVFRSFKFPLLLLSLSVLLFEACKKDKTEIPRTPAAGLMAFNLALDKPAVGISLSGNTLGNTAIDYTGYTGVYLPIYIGNREVRSFDYTNGSTIAITNKNFADSMYYSAFLLGANGSYRNVVVNDNFNLVTPVTGKAWIRYINAIPDSTISPAITLGEINENAGYATVSDFRQVNIGTLDISVKNGSSINTNRTINVEENKIYTVLFVGQPNQTDTTRAVKIRYIQNGTATN